MSTTYFQRDTAEAVTYVPGASATHQDQLSLSSAASNTETVSVASLASGVVCWTFIGPAGHPNPRDVRSVPAGARGTAGWRTTYARPGSTEFGRVRSSVS